jgi:hypothetical protein
MIVLPDLRSHDPSRSEAAAGAAMNRARKASTRSMDHPSLSSVKDGADVFSRQ